MTSSYPHEVIVMKARHQAAQLLQDAELFSVHAEIKGADSDFTPVAWTHSRGFAEVLAAKLATEDARARVHDPRGEIMSEHPSRNTSEVVFEWLRQLDREGAFP